MDAAHDRIGHRGDSVNEFEKHESLVRCREIFLSLRDEPFARVIDSNGTLDEVTARIRTAVEQTAKISWNGRISGGSQLAHRTGRA